MTPKVKKTSRSSRKLDDGKLYHFSPDVLDFDIENPRLAQSELDPSMDEIELIQFLWKEMNVEELALSIGAWGYFEHEPLIAEKKKSRYTVIEGNRRLAAVKILRNRELRSKLRISLPTLDSVVAKDLKKLPVVVTTRKNVWQYIGFKHVNGPKPWGSYEKAAYIARVHNDFGVSLEEIPGLIGDTHKTVRRLYRGLMVLRQAKDEGLYNIEDRTNKRLFFSHLYTGLSYPGFQSFLGLKEETSYQPKPVRGHTKKKNLGQLCVWLFGSKEQEKKSLIKSQNPDLRRLDESLQTERGRDALTAGLPLDIAYDASMGDERLFREALIRAKTQLEQAVGKVHTGFDIKSDQIRTATTIANVANSLVGTMEDLKSKSRKRKR